VKLELQKDVSFANTPSH